MNACVLELVFVFCVENQAVLVEEAHNGRLPTGAPQEIYDYVKEPVLIKSNNERSIRTSFIRKIGKRLFLNIHFQIPATGRAPA